MAKGSDTTSPVTDGGDVGGSQAPRSDPTVDPTGVAAVTGSQKRGRGRPPKGKSDDSQQNGAVSAQASRKSGRPKRTGASAPAAVKKNPGRPKRSSTVTRAASQVTATTVDGSRKRGRPKRGDSAATATVAPAAKRGRRAKPNTGEVAKKTVGRTRKVTSVATEATTSGQGAANARELKKKAALLKKKVKEAADKLKVAVAAIEEVQGLVADM